MAAATPEPLKTPVAAAFVSPGNDEDEYSCWYAFYSESQKREYYFNPDTGISTWVLPAGGRRFADPRMIETNPGFTPIGIGRFSFDMFDGEDDEASVHSEDGTWKEKSVIRANLIVLAMSLVGIFLSVAYSVFNVGGLLANVASALDDLQENVARTNAENLQSDLQRRATHEQTSTLYYPSWVNALNDPSVFFSVNDDEIKSAAVQSEQQMSAHKRLLGHSNQALYYPSWWNVLENINDPSRDVELDQLLHNLVSSLETADVLLQKIVIDAQQAGMELQEAAISLHGDTEAL